MSVTKMWKGHERALKVYCNAMIREWKRRGYNNTMKLYTVRGTVEIPAWWGNRKLHASHRAALLAKDYKHYKKCNWKEQPKVDYVWVV